MSFSLRRISKVFCGSSIDALSVSSSSSSCGSSPVSARMRRDRVDDPLRELARRQVDGYRHGAQALALPGQLFAGAPQHPLADGQDQAGLFGQADEAARRDQAQFRMLPAQQRLEADDLAARQARLRLVVHTKLVALERAPQRALEAETLVHALVQLRTVELVAFVLAGQGALQRRLGCPGPGRRSRRRRSETARCRCSGRGALLALRAANGLLHSASTWRASAASSSRCAAPRPRRCARRCARPSGRRAPSAPGARQLAQHGLFGLQPQLADRLQALRLEHQVAEQFLPPIAFSCIWRTRSRSSTGSAGRSRGRSCSGSAACSSAPRSSVTSMPGAETTYSTPPSALPQPGGGPDDRRTLPSRARHSPLCCTGPRRQRLLEELGSPSCAAEHFPEGKPSTSSARQPDGCVAGRVEQPDDAVAVDHAHQRAAGITTADSSLRSDSSASVRSLTWAPCAVQVRALDRHGDLAADRLEHLPVVVGQLASDVIRHSTPRCAAPVTSGMRVRSVEPRQVDQLRHGRLARTAAVRAGRTGVMVWLPAANSRAANSRLAVGVEQLDRRRPHARQVEHAVERAARPRPARTAPD
jgi:hypothetical protein